MLSRRSIWYSEHFCWTQVRSLAIFVSDQLTDWCDPCVRRCRLKTCWGCYCSWFWCRETCWRQFGADFEAEVWSLILFFVQTLCKGLVKVLKLKFKRNFETEVWLVFCCWGLVRLWSGCLVKILKLKFGRNACWDFELGILIKICVRTCYFGKQNSTLGSVVPLAMF